MLNMILWLCVACIGAVILLAAAAATMSLTPTKTERLMEQDVRR